MKRIKRARTWVALLFPGAFVVLSNFYFLNEFEASDRSISNWEFLVVQLLGLIFTSGSGLAFSNFLFSFERVRRLFADNYNYIEGYWFLSTRETNDNSQLFSHPGIVRFRYVGSDFNLNVVTTRFPEIDGIPESEKYRYPKLVTSVLAWTTEDDFMTKYLNYFEYPTDKNSHQRGFAYSSFCSPNQNNLWYEGSLQLENSQEIHEQISYKIPHEQVKLLSKKLQERWMYELIKNNGDVDATLKPSNG